MFIKMQHKYKQFGISDNHTVFYEIDNNGLPVTSPTQIINKWDSDHVRMSCSPLSFYPVQQGEVKSLKPRWKMITEALQKPIRSVFDLKNAIVSYNTRYEQAWNFEILIRLFMEDYSQQQNDRFFTDICPKIVKLALNLPNIVTKPIPLLKAGKSYSLSFSQLQIAALLANAFFCTFPRRNSRIDDAEYSSYPSINFSSLFCTDKKKKPQHAERRLEKLKCVLHYLERVSSRLDGEVSQLTQGVVTFVRRGLQHHQLPDWDAGQHRIGEVDLATFVEGSIFTGIRDSIKTDFANKLVGGGVLGRGSVQEEILFCTHPELLAARLFTESLSELESLLVIGTECFSQYDGYGDRFRFVGPHYDFGASVTSVGATVETDFDLSRDEFGRWRRCVSVIDATPFQRATDQYCRSAMMRELNKAYCGFWDFLPHDDALLPHIVDTGNWGCGVFGGDINLKFLLQLLVCAELQKDVNYFTFHCEEQKQSVKKIFSILTQNDCSVGSLWSLMNEYCVDRNREKNFKDIFQYIEKKLTSSE